MADKAWTLTVACDDLTDVEVVAQDASLLTDLEEGEALLAVDRVGLTANNVTYAVLGDSFRYWEHFPPDGLSDNGSRGIVPVWGFADVVASRTPGVEVGDRVYGYLPSGSHLRVTPVRVDATGFRDGALHRASLPSPYAVYTLTTGDPAYDAAREDLLVLFRPLFYTSFMLADFLVDHELFGGTQVVLTSASSKTAYGTAVELQRQGVAVVGLTSADNVAFTSEIGCYSKVFAYDDVDALELQDVVVADVAGRPGLVDALRARYGDRLRHVVGVGVTHQVAESAGTLEETGLAMFFAPDQMRKRTADWGRDELNRRFAAAWAGFVDRAASVVEVVPSSGSSGLRDAWLEVVGGGVDPRVGHVVSVAD